VNAGHNGKATKPVGDALVADIQVIWTFHALHSKTGTGSRNRPNELIETNKPNAGAVCRRLQLLLKQSLILFARGISPVMQAGQGLCLARVMARLDDTMEIVSAAAAHFARAA
jgi:hypothetical protein